MRILTLIILTIAIGSCTTNKKDELAQKVQTLELTYIAWACDCANWATQEDLKKYSDNIGDSLADQSIFVEPDNPSLALPDTLGFSNDVIRFTGQFYKNKGFPQGYQSSQDPEKASVFRYTKYEVLKSNYEKYQDLKIENE